MPVNVNKGEPAPAVAAAGSPLIDLRARREAKRKALHLDLKVPRWDDDGGPEIWARYNPASFSVAMSATERRRKRKDPEWMVLSNADTLADAMVGVFVKQGDQSFTLAGGQWRSFDPDTARDDEWVSVKGERVGELNAALGIDAHSAAETLRALFFTDGDLMAHSAKLAEFSGVSLPTADEEALGE